MVVQMATAQEWALGLKVRLLLAPGLQGLMAVTLAPALAQTDQALAQEQALPLALEGSGALEVVAEKDRKTGSHTCLTFAAFPKIVKDSKGVTAYNGTPA